MRLIVALAAAAALSGCVSAVVRTPPASEAYANVLVGRLANLREDHQAASDRFYHALAGNPRDATLQEGALTASLATGDLERARMVARMAGAEAGAPGYAHLIRAADAIAGGRWRQARDALGRVHGDAAAQLASRVMTIWARTGDGDVDTVATELERLSAMRPYGSLFSYQRAMALDFAGRGADAAPIYEDAARGGLWLPPALERRADLLARSGQREQAIEILEPGEGQIENPALAAARLRIEAGQSASAAPLTPARGAAIGLYGLSAIFLQESDSTHGLATLSLALMLDPDFDAAHLAVAEAQGDLNHISLARDALGRIEADSPYAESARVMESRLLLREEREDDAVALARTNANAGGVRSQRALADLYRGLERYEEAEPLYTALIEAQPGDWRLYFARGATRSELGRWEAAEADMQRALELSPEQPDVMNFLGYSWVDRGQRLEEGLALIQRAVAIRPLSGAIIDSLGWAEFRLGRFDRALEHLERAVELEPADPVLNDHLGDVYWRLGRRVEARFQWRRALSLDPSENDRPVIEGKVERGLPPLPRSATR